MVARTPRRRWRWALAAVLAVLVLTLLVGSVTTLAWGSSLRDDGRLLPGTRIAAVDVSDLTLDEARDAVEAVLAEQLDRTLTVHHDDVEATTTPRELGARTDLDQALAAATDRTSTAGFGDLVRARWLGADPSGRDVAITIDDDEEVAAFVAELADRIDVDATDADVEVEGASLTVREATSGRTVDVDDAVELLTDAALDPDADATLELPVTVIDPVLTTAEATAVAEATEAAVDAALDRAVTVTLEGESRRLTPREVDATVDRAALVAAGLEGDDVTVDDVTVGLDDGALRGIVDALASGKEVAARDASFDFADGAFEITEERTGAGVDRGAAVSSLRSALAGGSDTVTLELSTVRPSVTSDAFSTVILLEKSERTVSLYRDGERTQSWPVAVGAASSPTPTGQFTVGAKRFEPTWVNPAPDRWGKDLPARMGPGPDNPLGVRAINWSDNGRDNLIRFHGTPNEDSIGSATSNGCVRMFNEDVIELYDQVSTGTLIVSVD